MKDTVNRIKPYHDRSESKEEQIVKMFDGIATHYDLLNHTLSLGIDRCWRKKVVHLLDDIKNPVLLDVATGTGDLALALSALKPVSVYAVDISTKMLEIAYKKIKKRRLQMTVFPKIAAADELPFANNTFNAVTVGFGVRNFENLTRSLTEMTRVLKPGGKMAVLEFSKPAKFPVKQLYMFYFTKILPWWGGIVSGDRKAYRYLASSVIQFPEGELFEQELVKAGLMPICSLRQTFGIATIYLAQKPLSR
ncbi:MAG: bifunctional demethylmenaquinone methyltransferase/2-methoxy-6-polyprenyl-1,4-benzoquinol methylase UbiE [Cytophagaceae bacterium]|nr:bifunctional demethylmenaquinone methyltransferase/2-methoxy-6-polyprenyl-1,4-benzoquinol methylase UbiE [Cytophagaceae bacterium]